MIFDELNALDVSDSFDGTHVDDIALSAKCSSPFSFSGSPPLKTSLDSVLAE